MRLEVGGVSMKVEHKDIKNVHLAVHPPEGRVSVSAPRAMRLETIRVFVISKLDWIRRQQAALRKQERETPRRYIDRESHYLWGERYLLRVEEAEAPPLVKLKGKQLLLRIRPGADAGKRAEILAAWYRDHVRERAEEMILSWTSRLGVTVNHLYVQTMKTRWGGCKPERGNIRLNTELAKKPPRCLEYIVVHELLHLLEPTHTDRFRALLDEHLPMWRVIRDELNSLPVKHEAWGY